MIRFLMDKYRLAQCLSETAVVLPIGKNADFG